MLSLKGLPAGRFLWQLGTDTVNKLGLFSLQNCAFTNVDTPRAFTWTFDALMLGSGVGFNIQREVVYKLPRISKSFKTPVRKDTASADFIVPDSRAGWAELLERTLQCAFYGAVPFDYSTQLIRGKGAPIKGFGGVASGPEELVWGIGEIGKLISARKGKQLRPIDCLDVMNIIGHVVVSGNVRRSAQIAIGDADDLEYLRSKRWDLGIPNWRAMSNNSVVCENIDDLPEEFWKGYDGSGEPFGLINLRLAQAIGRTGETQYPDPDVQGFNPCAEQGLEDKETCCLAEMFLPNLTSYEEFIKVLSLLYRVAKHSLRLKCHAKDTEKIVHKNMRMGIGITGYLQATEEQRQWLSSGYEALRAYDVAYSAEKKWPVSIKLSTVKPSGTLSLGPGVTPGCHPAYAQYMIRRIRISSNNELVDVCRKAGYVVEPQRLFDGSIDLNTMVVEFPFSYPEGTVLAKDMTAVKQLDIVRRLQAEWSDNSVSCTVYYRKEELPEIRAYLKEHYRDELKTVSFLLHSDHGFDQAPFEEITKEEYDKRMSECTLITDAVVAEFEASDECVGGMCPIR